MRSLLLGLPLALAAAPGVPALSRGAPALQEGEAPADDELLAKIDKYIGLARTGRIAVRPQAAQRLVRIGAPAAKRLREECGEDGSGLASLGQYLVEVLGELEDPVLRAHLWSGLIDRDFPWRGPAARTLAKTATAAELESFRSFLDDHLAQVRVAAVDAMGILDARGEKERVRERLEDQNDRVRRAAAGCLDRWGEAWALAWLVEDLKRTDRFFRMPLGMQARYEAIRVLRERLGDDFGYVPERDPGDPASVAAIEAIEEAARERAGGDWPRLPEIARAGVEIEGNRFGLELRSCRQGEHYLRWHRDDLLYVGTGRPVAIRLEAGTVARLEGRIREALAELGEERYWGAPGCDLEQFHLAIEEDPTDSFLLSKGPDSVPDLRPAPLDEVVRLLLETLPEGPREDPRTSDLRRRVRGALEALGGEF